MNQSIFFRRKFHWILLALISLFLLIVFASPASAQLRGGELLQRTIDASVVSETAMDDMWDELFKLGDEAYLYNQLIQVSSIVLLVAFPFLMLAFANAAKENNSAKVGEIIAWGLIVVVLLADKGAMLKTATKGMRRLINDQATAVLAVQVDTLTVKDAMRDLILTEKLRDEIRNAATECEAKEGAAQLECYSEAADYAEDIVKEYESKGWLGSLPGLKRYIAGVREQKKRYDDAYAAAKSDPEERKSIEKRARAETNALFLHTVTGSANRAILKSFQNWFTYGFEFALMLTGMIGPLAAAASLMPTSPRALFSWLIGISSIGILKLSYNLVVGFIALYASQAGISDSGSAGFITMVSVGAPLISVAVAGGGGAATFFALGKTTAMVATIIPVGGSMAASAVSSAAPRR